MIAQRIALRIAHVARLVAAPVVGYVLFAGSAGGQTLYVASGSNGVAGTLYTMNPANGLTTPVGPLANAAGAPMGLTGMAFHPTTGVLYGSTANLSPNSPGFLVTINPATAIVTVLGDIFPGSGGTASDISFAPDGTLYGWQSNSQHTLLSLNLATGLGTSIGAGLGTSVFGGGALAVRPSDSAAFVTPDGSTAAQPTFRSVNLGTGVATTIAPYGLTDSIAAMDFDGAATLFGLATNSAAPALTQLVTLNPVTGVATIVAPTNANNLDAMAFQRAIPEPVMLGGIAIGMIGIFARRRHD